MAVDPQFMAALAALGQAGQQYFVGEQMQQVNARAQEIRSAIMPDMERRRAMQDLAQMAQISVTGSGGSATQAAAIQNLMPQTPSSAVQAVLAGQLNGDALMTKVGTDIIRQDQDFQMKKLNAQLYGELQKELAKKNAGRPLSEGASKALSDIDQSKALLGQIKALVQKGGANARAWIGPIDGRVPEILNTAENNAFRAQLGQLMDAYRQAVTGASAADREIAKLESRMPNMTDTFDTFMKKLSANQNVLNTRGGAVLDAYSKSGYDTSGWKTVSPQGFQPAPRQSRGAAFFTPDK